MVVNFRAREISRGAQICLILSPHETTTCEVGGALHEQTNEMKLLGIKKQVKKSKA
jgi:hypothetical protein